MRNTTSGAIQPQGTPELEAVFAANLTTRRSLVACLAVGVTAAVLVAIGFLGPSVPHPLSGEPPHSGPRLTESAFLELRAVAEARAVVATRPTSPLTESALLELRAVAEARALAATLPNLRLTESTLLELRAVAEARALAAVPGRATNA